MKISDIFDNLGIKLICLLLAITIWLYANRDPKTDTERGEPGKIKFHEVPVQLSGIPQDEWKPKPERISLEVEFTTAEVAANTFHVEVRLMPGDGKEKRVALTAANVELPAGMAFVKAEPDELELVR
ncbi:hypothetical protein ACFL6S_13490 [Candidatus Poribacteria bacterium]